MKKTIIFDKKSKRGDIPITILAIGVVLVCILTIASFFLVAANFGSKFDTQTVKDAKLLAERHDFYINAGLPQVQADQMTGVKTDSTGRYMIVDRGFLSARYDLP